MVTRAYSEGETPQPGHSNRNLKGDLAIPCYQKKKKVEL